MANIGNTKIPSTGNAEVDAALSAQAQANAQSIVLSTQTNTAVTEINAVSKATNKIQPS
ncbi:MAG: hypothetical protein JWM36_2489 [Hyphomicrobiales bacterium]|jgi:hypothetical protein|nr:hypothetical protein [Hyphomicrobiales bacterium]